MTALSAARDSLQVVAETADVALLGLPLRSEADLFDIERIPLDRRLKIDDFCKRIDLALASRAPDDIALYYVPDGDVEHEPEEITFAAMRDNVRRTAALLRASGIGPTDIVAVLLPAIPSIYWSLLGAMEAGVAFPVNWMMERDQLLHLLKQADAKAVIALGPTPGFTIWETMMAIAPGLSPDVRVFSVAGPGGTRDEASDLDLQLATQASWRPEPKAGSDIAVYMHSGGTTGAPKIIKLSHLGLSYRHWTFQLALRFAMDDVFVHDTPMFHVGGFIGRVFTAVASGATMLIPSVMGARDRRYIANFWKFIERYRVTRVAAVPTTLATLVKSPPVDEDISSLKPLSATGSTALPVSVQQGFGAISGVRMLNTYGMTENTATVSVDPRDGPTREGSSGLRMPYTQVRTAVMGEGGQVQRFCEADEIGMLLVKGPGVAPGFVSADHERGARTPDGWIISGDLGRIDADGYIFVTGRAKDVIIRGGHNIDPALIEEPLSQSPDVLLVAAVGKPDAYAGELPVAYVQLVEGSTATPDQLSAYLQGRIGERAAFPKDIFIFEKLPLTAVGKPLKNKLKQDAAERVFRSVVAEALGWKAGDRRFDVTVRPDKKVGTLATIEIACRDQEQASIEARIKAAMAPFAMASSIVWRRDA